MFKAQCEISITNTKGKQITFSFCNSIEIDSSYEDLTDTCKIVIPRKLTFDGLYLFSGDNPIYKRGDRITVKMGYYPNLETVFTGYISKVGSNVPTVLECEDEMFKLKQYTVNYPSQVALITKSAKGKLLKHPKVVPFSVKLDELMDFCLTEHDIKYEVIDNIDLGSFRAVNATPAQILDKLKSEYGLFSYFINDKLHVGFANDASITKEAEFKMEEVIINSDTLEWQNADEIRIKCVAISMNPDNTKTEVEFGDPDGNQITIHKYNMDEKSLKFAAQQWIDENKYTGFKGEVETFGEPILNHGDRCKLTSIKLPERDGTYLIKKVKRVFSVDKGNHQFFTLGIKVA